MLQKKCEFELAQECLHKAEDFGSLVLLASASGNSNMMEKLADSSKTKGQNNISFLSYFVLGKLEECLNLLIDTNRLPEAAFFARTYMPSKINEVVELWRGELAKTNEKAAQALAAPDKYENLFTNYKESLQAEQFLVSENSTLLPASKFPTIVPNQIRKPLEEMHGMQRVSGSTESDENSDAEFADPEEEGDSNENSATLAKKISEIKMSGKDDIDDVDIDVDDLELDDIDTNDVLLDDDDDDDVDLSD